ncbi:MAG: BspA family leucine-rich repeat surface protein, partial [Bacteroidales bacterium]|nr:BspA family leucine-rich repeat surface protein [Bacteroidales bacterium]
MSDISSFDTSNVTDMRNMFELYTMSATTIKQDLSK